jgi:hypothetical protein
LNSSPSATSRDAMLRSYSRIVCMERVGRSLPCYSGQNSDLWWPYGKIMVS